MGIENLDLAPVPLRGSRSRAHGEDHDRRCLLSSMRTRKDNALFLEPLA